MLDLSASSAILLGLLVQNDLYAGSSEQYKITNIEGKSSKTQIRLTHGIYIMQLTQSAQ